MLPTRSPGSAVQSVSAREKRKRNCRVFPDISTYFLIIPDQGGKIAFTAKSRSRHDAKGMKTSNSAARGAFCVKERPVSTPLYAFERLKSGGGGRRSRGDDGGWMMAKPRRSADRGVRNRSHQCTERSTSNRQDSRKVTRQSAVFADICAFLRVIADYFNFGFCECDPPMRARRAWEGRGILGRITQGCARRLACAWATNRPPR